MKAALPHLATIHVRVSKPDAFIKLQILESEEVVISATGKGQAIIPVFSFLGNEKVLSSQCKLGFKKVFTYLCIFLFY